MSKFNSPKTSKSKVRVTNLAGGSAYDTSAEYKLVSKLLTSFIEDQFYKKASDSMDELEQLLTKVDPLFAAKAALYARREFGMRSISHFTAAKLAPFLSGTDWASRFYDRIIFRVDDMLEIASIILSDGKLPNAVKKGFAKAFNRFDGYQLAKYRGEGKEISLVDIVNLVHPTPIEGKNDRALCELVNGTLKNTNTWESKMTKAGQEKTSKKEVWRELLSNGKLGYFALLRNLRNIIETKDSALIADAATKLVNAKAIKKSLVLPFRYSTALTAIEEAGGNRTIERALNTAMEISVSNVPVFDGKTLVVLDTSGSMYRNKKGGFSYRSIADLNPKCPVAIGSLFAAALFKHNDSDLMAFGTRCDYVNARHTDSLQTIREQLIATDYGGTDHTLPYQTANKAYQRIIVLSDEQSWANRYRSPKDAFNVYKRKYNCAPYLYVWDLQGYGSLQFPETGVATLSGFSEKVFDLMKLCETDKRALINTIHSIEL